MERKNVTKNVVCSNLANHLGKQWIDFEYNTIWCFVFTVSSWSFFSTAVFPSLWTVTVPVAIRKKRANERERTE